MSALEHVTAGARRRVRVVVALVRVAAQACGSLDARSPVRRVVAAVACDGCMALGLVQRGQRRGRVTAVARGGGRHASGAMRTVARRAAAGDRSVRIVALFRVARGARGRGRGLARVGLVTPDAALVSGWSRALLRGVTG